MQSETITEKPRYVDMTADERRAAYAGQREAVEVHINAFVNRPYRGSYDDDRCVRHQEACHREAAFILRCAKSRGDQWAVSA